MFIRLLTIGIIFPIFLTSLCLAQQQSTKTQQDEIIEMEKAFALAIKSQDTTRAEQFQTETYFLAIGVQGMPLQVVPRSRWLAGLKDYVTESFNIDDIKVNVYGNTAVAMLLYTQKATVRGQDRSAQFMLTDIWVKGEKGWQISERHSSRPEVPAVVRPK